MLIIILLLWNLVPLSFFLCAVCKYFLALLSRFVTIHFLLWINFAPFFNMSSFLTSWAQWFYAIAILSLLLYYIILYYIILYYNIIYYIILYHIILYYIILYYILLYYIILYYIILYYIILYYIILYYIILYYIIHFFLFIYLYHSALRPGTAQYCKSNKLKGGQKQQNSKNN